jgi:hypothetical protein
MIAYNITIKVSHSIREEWLVWLQQEHIPAILSTQLFDDYKLYRLLEQDETEGPTFIIQLFTSSMERYGQYIIEFAPKLQQASRGKWGNNFIAFRTIMEVVH